METFTFYDKDTGDLIQTGSANDYSLSSQTTRAVAAFDLVGPSVVSLNFDHDLINEKLYMPDHLLPGKPQFNFEISPTSSAVYHSPTDFSVPHNATKLASIEESSTPCPKKPRILAATHFYVPHECFASLKAGIDHCLTQRSELVFSSFPKKHMWKCKYLEGSQSREMHIHCFWDNTRKSHLVEVKRVHGDGLFPQFTDLTTVLRQGLLPPPPVPHTDTQKLRPVPCMPPSLLSKSQKINKECSSAPVTESAFRETLHTLHDMAQNAYYEPRLEAVKMLCDTMFRPVSHTFWQPNSVSSDQETGYIGIQTLLLETLFLFLRDSHTPVMEFGVVATHALLDRCPQSRSWLMAFKDGVLVEYLIKHIRNCQKSSDSDYEDHEEEFYQYAHMRRLAGKAVNLIIMDACAKCCGGNNNENSNNQSRSMCKQRRRTLMATILQRAGYFSREHWLEYISGLEDAVLRESVLSVQDCY